MSNLVATSASVPSHIVYARECKMALEWFYSLSEAEKYEEYKSYCKRYPLEKHYDFEQFCVSLGRIQRQWDYRGRKLI